MSTPPLRLLTVRFSHFCEKARWALDRAGLAYREESHVPILSWPMTFGVGGKRTVPVLVAPDRVISDSTDILRWVDGASHAPPLFPDGDTEVAAWEDELDRRLGPAARRLVYFHLLEDDGYVRELFGSSGGPWQERVSNLVFPALRAMVVRGLKIDASHAARSQASIDELFAKVATRLADGRRYLVGDRFTAADLTFASLATPLVVPDAYRTFMPARPVSADVEALIARHRATPAGAFILRLYDEERARRAC